MNFDVEFNVTNESFIVQFDSSGQSFDAQFGEITRVLPDPYEGEYEVTPTNQTQTLLTKNKSLVENVVVKPIPQNYGLITYNGSYIMVS